MRIICLLAFLFLAAISHAQDSSHAYHHHYFDQKKKISLLAGYNGANYQFAEIGLALNTYGVNGHHPMAWAMFVSDEIEVRENPVMGFKAGAWVSGGFLLGSSLVYYTDFNEGSLRFRPEIGVGIYQLKVSYGYNFAIVNRDFDRLNKHCINLVWLFGLKTLKHIQH